jgi:Electron transfer DM13
LLQAKFDWVLLLNIRLNWANGLFWLRHPPNWPQESWAQIKPVCPELCNYYSWMIDSVKTQELKSMSRKKYLVAAILLPTLIGVSLVQTAGLRSVQADMMMKKGGAMMGKKMKSMVGGEFIAAEHPTKGAVAIVKENGKQYIEFSDQFKSDSGPDLFVLLHRQAKPDQYKQADYVNLGQLQKVKGSQRYMIPADTKLSDYQSVVIWCRKFNATFGYAPLMASSMAK